MTPILPNERRGAPLGKHCGHWTDRKVFERSALRQAASACVQSDSQKPHARARTHTAELLPKRRRGRLR